MSLAQLGGEPYIYWQISKEIKPTIQTEIKQLLKKKITPINDHLESLINNRSEYYGQGAAKFSNLIKEKLFTKQDKGYKKTPFIFSTTLLELLARVETDDKFYVVDYSFDGFFVNEKDNLTFGTGINIDGFMRKKYPETVKREIIGIKSNYYTNLSTEIRKEYMKEITPKIEDKFKEIEEKFEEIEVPTDISENDAQQQHTEPFSATLDAVVNNENKIENGKKPTAGGQRRNRKSKKARKTKKARKSRKNRRKSNRRRR